MDSRAERLEDDARARSSRASGGDRPAVAPSRLCAALIWSCLLLLVPWPAAGHDQTTKLALAVARRASPARRLQQACQPWPLYFKNKNCNGTAAITIRAQLAAPPEPSDAPCINGASQSGDWCVRSMQLGYGQQQLAFPQLLHTTFQAFAEVELPSGPRWFGGNQTSPETPWFDTASGQPCSLPQQGNATDRTTCKPFLQLNAAQSNGSCPDPRDTQPYFIECGDANTTTCSTKLRVQNNCTLNIRLLVYGVLAADAQPGYCVNLATRQGEACLRSALTYTAGQADTGDTYAFEGLYQDGLHYYAWVPRTTYEWAGDNSGPDAFWVNINSGERCAGPDNSCYSFRQVAMDSGACGSTTTLNPSCPNTTCNMPHCTAPLQLVGECFCSKCDEGWQILDDFMCKSQIDVLQQLSGCKVVPYDVLNSTFGDPACANWATKTYVLEPCPPACDFQGLPSECLNSVAQWMVVTSKGLAPNATLPNFVNAVLSACAAGKPVDAAVVTAMAQEALSPIASCGPGAPAAVMASTCSMTTGLMGGLTSGLLTNVKCDPECNALLNSITVDCFVAFVMRNANLEQMQGAESSTMATLLRNYLKGMMGACGEGVTSPAPSPAQPAAETTSSSGSVPIGAIAGGVVGAVAAALGCAFLVMALRRRRQRQVQRASSAGKAVDEFVTDGLDSSKAATPSHQLSLASLDSGGAPAALHSDPLVSYIYASQLASKASQRSCTSAARSQGSGGGGVQAWEMEWADLQLQRVVYLASWGTIPVAVKVLLVPGAAGTNLAAPGAAQEALALPPSALAELEAEAGLLASLRHPCCVNFYGVTRSPPALVTEYCARGSVAELLDRARADPAVAAELTWHRRLAMALDAAVGMVYLHGHKPSPIIHRDLKSPNLLVDDAWRTKVTDFGLSRVTGEDSDLSSSLAVTNPRWLAPELMRGERATQASDMFAYGRVPVILWELLTWERPWGATNPWQISAAVLGGRRLEVPDPAALPGPGSGSPEGLAAYLRLMQHCWAQAPGERPSFAEVVQLVRALLDGEAALES